MVFNYVMKVLVTGGAGFIGSNLCQKLLKLGFQVRVVDNFSSGFIKNLEGLNIELVNENLENRNIIYRQDIFGDIDIVFHLAANVDNRFTWENPHLSLEANTISTLNVGLGAKNHQVKKIIYASTGTVYGAQENAPFFESDVAVDQTSLYAATKLSGEMLLSVFSHHHNLQVSCLRFVGVLGPCYSHGHIYDFVKQLLVNKNSLTVLGNGDQKKAYIHVDDLCQILVEESQAKRQNGFEVINIGREDYSTVKQSVRWICEEMKVEPKVIYGESKIGWIGDNPQLYLDTQRARNLGYGVSKSIEASVKETANWLVNNQWIFEKNNSAD